MPRGVRHTWAAEGAGANSDGPRSAERMPSFVDDSVESNPDAFEAVRGAIEVAGADENRGSGTGFTPLDETTAGALTVGVDETTGYDDPYGRAEIVAGAVV